MGARERKRVVFPAVPIRLLVSTFMTVGVLAAEMSLPSATTLRRSEPPPRSIALNPAHWAPFNVTVSSPELPVSVSTPDTAPTVRSTAVPVLASTMRSRVPLPELEPPWIDLPATNCPLAMLTVSSPPPELIVSAPNPPVMVSLPPRFVPSTVMRLTSGQCDALIVTPLVSPGRH